MLSHDDVLIVWLLGAMQVAGLTSALAARLSVGSTSQKMCQRVFLACLALMGAGTVASFAIGPGLWLLSAFTLSGMVLITTCDFGHELRAERVSL